jgi:hypothetical protein
MADTRSTGTAWLSPADSSASVANAVVMIDLMAEDEKYVMATL